MRFGQKIILGIISLISIILGISRYYVVKENFWYSIHNAYSQNWNKHILEKYMIENDIVKNIQEGKEFTNEILIEQVKSLHEYISDVSELVTLYSENYNIIYSNFNEISKIDIKKLLDSASTVYSIEEIDKSHYMIFSAPCEMNNTKVYIVNSYNIDYLYRERNRQIKEFLLRDVFIVAISFIVFEIIFKLVSKHVNRLNLLVKQKDDFVTGFMHELKTPMTAIIGYSDMLRLKKCDKEVEKKALNYIYLESKRLENLSHKLLSLMALSTEHIKLESVDIKDLLEKIMGNVLVENKIEIKIEEAKVLADKELLEVVIRNLVQNADKADPKDNKILIIGKKLENKKYRVFVIDNGKGIPSEHISRVTEDFYMVDKSRSRQNGGSGIGLSLVCKILNFHGAKLNIESKEQIGTTVYFDLKEAKNEI